MLDLFCSQLLKVKAWFLGFGNVHHKFYACVYGNEALGWGLLSTGSEPRGKNWFPNKTCQDYFNSVSHGSPYSYHLIFTHSLIYSELHQQTLKSKVTLLLLLASFIPESSLPPNPGRGWSPRGLPVVCHLGDWQSRCCWVGTVCSAGEASKPFWDIWNFSSSGFVCWG